MRETLRRLRSLVTRARVEDGLDEEIRFHIDQQTAKNVRAGMSAEEARRRAFIQFGGVDPMKERTRDEFRLALFEDLALDMRYGVRLLLRSPGHALVAVLTLGIGIGAATAVFSVVQGVLLAPLPYPQSDRIVRLHQINADGRRTNTVSEPNFDDWKARTRGFGAMAMMSPGRVPVTIGDEATMLPGAGVSREFFDAMRMQPSAGRLFAADELVVGGAPAVIISDRLWRTRLGAVPIDELRLRISEDVHQVVGVMPPEFDFPSGSDFWIPSELSAPNRSRTAHNWMVVARLADGVSLTRAAAELSELSRALKQEHGDGTWMSDATAVPLLEQLTAATRPVLLLLFGASLVLLVIACLNVSNLQLARASARRRELALRLAVGAGRGRIARQLLAEAVVLSLASAACGVLLAYGGVQLLTATQPANLPRVQDVRVDALALAFAIGAALVTAVVLGLATALRAARQDVRDGLGDASRSVAGGRAAERVRQGLMVSQVALTIVLLVGAGLLARSFVKLLAVDPGFHTDQALLVDLQWSYSRDPDVQQRRQARQQQLLERLATLPGVERAGLVNTHPLATGGFADGQFVEMTRPDELQSFDDVARLGEEAKARAGFAGYRVASEGYFGAAGLRLIRGRLFEPGDGPDAPHVAVISESLAASKWPDRDPIGRFVQFGNMDGDLRGFRIVGIVSDVREVSPETVPGPLFYGYYRQRMAPRFTVVLKTSAGASLAPAVRQAVRDVDPELPLQVRRVEDAFDLALAGRRFSLTLIGVFGMTALLLATLGVYGLMSYLVAERTREIGVRLALGADVRDVLQLVIGGGVLLALMGMVLGLGAALALTRFLEGLLFGVTAADPLALGGVLGVVLVAVVAASYAPARRALQVAPVEAMRAE